MPIVGRPNFTTYVVRRCSWRIWKESDIDDWGYSLNSSSDNRPNPR
jgi:hypothetical protein